MGEAKDNAAYWSISTTLKSDNKALGTVKDALSLGAATVDVAYQGLNKSLEVLDQIKTKLTAATQDGVDKDAINGEIKELQKQLKSIASSAAFSGENWLSTISTAGNYSTNKTVVSSFNRDDNGNVTIGTVDFDISSSVLYDGSNGGILQKQTDVNKTTAMVTSNVAVTTDVTFTVAIGSAATETLTISKAGVQAVGDGDATVDNANELASLVRNQIEANANLKGKISVAVNAAGALEFTSVGNGSTVATTAATDILAGGAAVTPIAKVSVSTIDIASAAKSDIEAYIGLVNTATNSVTAAAAKLGAVSSRIELQQNFVNTLVDTIDKGISGLIDADLSEESTRLQALQTKQQLGVQALSIANSSTANVLRLFQQ